VNYSGDELFGQSKNAPKSFSVASRRHSATVQRNDAYEPWLPDRETRLSITVSTTKQIRKIEISVNFVCPSKKSEIPGN
jgi:hypothetical protein